MEELEPQYNFVPNDTQGGSLGSLDKLKPNTMPPEFGDPLMQYGGGSNQMVGKAMQSVNYAKGKKGAGWRISANGDAEFQNIRVNNVQAGGVIEVTVQTTDDLQTALDEINAQGGGTLRLSPGTYVVNNDLVVYDNTFIEGDSSGNTTITFASQAYGITYTGTDVYTTGTLSVNQGSTAVTGSGTTWTSAMIGRQIFISNRWYVIANVGSTTSITLATAFADANVSGGTYRIADPINNVGIKNVTITGSTTNAIEGLDIRDFYLYDVVCVANGVGMSLTNYMNVLPEVSTNAANTSHGATLTNGSFLNANSFSNVSNGGSGVVTNNIKSCTFSWSAANANTADGYNCTDTDSCAFKLELSGNGGQGIEFVSGCDNNFIDDSLVVGNTSDGIKLTATSDNNTIAPTVNITNNGGYGINIAAATCDNNCIFGPYFASNSSGSYSDSGTNTDIITRATASAATSNFGGDGSDGSLAVTSGTTNIDASGANIVVKNYTSISISSGATLSLTNAATDGTILVLKSTGNVTIDGKIDLKGKGAQEDNNPFGILDSDGDHYAPAAPTAGSAYSNQSFYPNFIGSWIHKTYYVVPGAPGGGGTATAGSGSATPGTGGNGGGALIIECAGALDFSSSGEIDLSGNDGTPGTRSGAGSVGGSGGGATGTGLVIYSILTDNSGTKTTVGGAGTDGQYGGDGNQGAGGGGGGCKSDGGAGLASGATGTATAGSNGSGGGGGSANAGGAQNHSGAAGGTLTNGILIVKLNG